MNQRLSILALSALLGALAIPAIAQKAGGDTTTMTKETSPGKGTLRQERQIIATVEEVDAAKGQVTLKGPKGNLVPLTVGPEVRNLAQVKVGDQVRVRYAEALTLTLKKGGKELPSSKEASEAIRAPAGARPGGAVGEQVTVIANVIAVNAKTHEVTLKGPNQTVDLYVEDPKQLKLIKVGDQVEAVYTQAVAITVEPVAAKK
jgi:Cu/Ag efflux protein CusF